MKNVSEESINAWTGSGFGLDLLDTQEDGSVRGDVPQKSLAHTQMAKCKLCHKQRSDPEEFLRYEHN